MLDHLMYPQFIILTNRSWFPSPPISLIVTILSLNSINATGVEVIFTDALREHSKKVGMVGSLLRAIPFSIITNY